VTTAVRAPAALGRTAGSAGSTAAARVAAVSTLLS
jgi:hypothetical protein